MQIPFYLINLESRKDRLAYMSYQFETLGLEWQRVEAIDAKGLQPNQFQNLVTADKRIAMSLPSECCAITVLKILRSISSSNNTAAFVVQDDIELSHDISLFARDTKWIPKDIGLLQFERHGKKPLKWRIVGELKSSFANREIRKLESRAVGAGCFLVTKEAAETIVQKIIKIDAPIDHLLFNPVVSPIFDDLGVGIVLPAVARQRTDKFESDIRSHRVTTKKSLRYKIKRLMMEFSAALRIFKVLKKDCMLRRHEIKI